MDRIDRFFARFQPVALSLLRFIIGLLLLQYGIAKWFKFPPVPAFANPPPLSLAAGAIELVFGTMLLTRPVAFILAGEMAFAYFIGHFPRGFFPLVNGGTAAIAFCFACLYLATAGGGPYSVDAAIRGKANNRLL